MAKKGKDDPTVEELQEQVDGLRAIAEALGVDDVDKALEDIAWRKDGTPVWLGATEEPEGEPGGEGDESGSGGEGDPKGGEGQSGDPGESEGDSGGKPSENGGEGGAKPRMRTRTRGTMRGGGRTGGGAKPVKEMSEAEKVKHYRETVRPDVMGESR